MPPKSKISKNDILTTALDILRKHGEDGINARAIASSLNCSTQPIFSNYISMEELRQDVIKEAYSVYLDYQQDELAQNKYPPYKASGMAYIRFAKEEKELFKLLFMRDRSTEKINRGDRHLDSIIEIICKQTGLSREQAQKLHLELWIYVHGIAAMLVTDYLELDEDTVSEILTDAYEGIKTRFITMEVKA